MPRKRKPAAQTRTPAAERWVPLHYLKLWRKRVGYTQAQLGHRVGKDHSSIGKIENGKTRLTEETIKVLTDALRIAPGDLFRDPRDTRGAWAMAERIARLPPDKLGMIEAVIASLEGVSNGS